MTQQELLQLYPGDIVKVDIPGWVVIPEGQIVKFVDYNADGLPDKAFVYGKSTSGTDAFIPCRPDAVTFIRHDPKIDA